MAFAYHKDRTRYFEDQCRVTEDYLVPFVEADRPLPDNPRVLEIGCAEAGVLLAFLKRGGTAVGVDRNQRRLDKGREFHASAIRDGKIELINIDAAELAKMPGYFGTFDLIVLKDVIEHIDDKPNLFGIMARLLRPGGRVFLSFPPWSMPFGGHQQTCDTVLSKVPYLHLLPQKTYETVLRKFGEKPNRVASLMDNYRTGLSIDEFSQVAQAANFRVLNRRLYLTNPIYQYRFGLRPMEQFDWITRATPVRDFITTCAYFLVEPNGASA